MIILHFEYNNITEILLEVSLGTKNLALHVESYFMYVLGESRLALLLQFYYWIVDSVVLFWYSFYLYYDI
jgi:hypothetical protein